MCIIHVVGSGLQYDRNVLFFFFNIPNNVPTYSSDPCQILSIVEPSYVPEKHTVTLLECMVVHSRVAPFLAKLIHFFSTPLNGLLDIGDIPFFYLYLM